VPRSLSFDGVRNNDWFELVVEGIPVALLMADQDRRISLVNRNTETLFGYSRSELIGEPLELLVPPRFRGQHAAQVSTYLKAPTQRRMGAGRELFGRRKNNTEMPIEIGLNPIRTAEGIFTLASIIDITERKGGEEAERQMAAMVEPADDAKTMRDITERERSERELRRSNAELAQRNTELDNFVSIASHDLRAPLTGISSIVQWILEDDRALALESRERLGLIRGRIERMKQLLTDIRDYARNDRDAVPSGTPVSAATLVANVAAMAHVPPGFSIRSDPSLELVQVQRVPLEQVLLNLVDNAIKHHDLHAGTVTVSVQHTAPWLRFSVIDDGPGVPEEYRESIFEMFKTLKPRDEVEGSGMGLALVRKIVGKMGGRCEVDSAAKRGSHFWFEWPPIGRPPRGEG
jgi:PAS domain S-box-containing protein